VWLIASAVTVAVLMFADATWGTGDYTTPTVTTTTIAPAPAPADVKATATGVVTTTFTEPAPTLKPSTVTTTVFSTLSRGRRADVQPAPSATQPGAGAAAGVKTSRAGA
jgi:hypothetical protein